jgi:hypothetical protein
MENKLHLSKLHIYLHWSKDGVSIVSNTSTEFNKDQQ